MAALAGTLPVGPPVTLVMITTILEKLAPPMKTVGRVACPALYVGGLGRVEAGIRRGTVQDDFRRLKSAVAVTELRGRPEVNGIGHVIGVGVVVDQTGLAIAVQVGEMQVVD